MRNGKQETMHGVRRGAALTIKWRGRIGLLCAALAATVVSPAQDEQPSPDAVTFKTLVNLASAFYSVENYAWYPVQGTDGNLYATSSWAGGPNNNGTIFKVTPDGALTTIYDFCAQANCTDGANPLTLGALDLGTDGYFYGTTINGGAFGWGTLFKTTPRGTLTALHSFCPDAPNCINGDSPQTGVVQGADGNFYGMTPGGGSNNFGLPCTLGVFSIGCGTVFKVTPGGAFTTIYNFCAQTNCADGAGPFTALTPGNDGNLYGITSAGGIYTPGFSGIGTIFKITPSGDLTTLHSFSSTEGNCGGYVFCSPMIQATNGNFYGTTTNGGANSGGADGGAGTIFEVTPGGTLTTLYNFCFKPNCADGATPQGLVQGTDGNFYGVTYTGGSNSCSIGACGTIFKLTPGGVLTTLHDFEGTDGEYPFGLVQATNGTFYGIAQSGGANGQGTVFSLSVGLGPFVETLPTSGRVGENIKLLGNDLTTATSVSFNGAPAVFTVRSKTLISATVPTGATTGFLRVAGSGGKTLKSNTRFVVRP